MVLSSWLEDAWEDGNPESCQVGMKMKPTVRAEPRGKETLILITSFGFQAHVMPESHPETFQ